MRAELTICIPSYLRPQLVKNCIDKAHRHTSTPHKFLVIHDGPEPLPEMSFDYGNPDVEVINLDEWIPESEKRNLMVSMVETPYFTKLDCDLEVLPSGINYELRSLKDGPDELGAVSSLRSIDGIVPRFCGVGNFQRFFGCIIVNQFTVKHLLKETTKYNWRTQIIFRDIVALGLTTFKTEMFQDVAFDPQYDMGYGHPDLFLQMQEEGWKAGIVPCLHFNEIKKGDTHKGSVFIERLARARIHFKKKWGLEFADAYSTDLKPRIVYNLFNYYGKVKARL